MASFIPSAKIQRIRRSLKTKLLFWKEAKMRPMPAAGQATQTIYEESANDDRTCAVCLSAVAGEEEVMPCCGSLIHKHCIQEWIQTSMDARCPYCRHDITLPPEEKAVLDERRRVVKQAEIEETARNLRVRQECAQQIFDIFCATHQVQLDAEVVWSWIVNTQIRPVTRMLHDFEKWYLEHHGLRSTSSAALGAGPSLESSGLGAPTIVTIGGASITPAVLPSSTVSTSSTTLQV
jgi:DNA-directed RNA polymerase subunit RPC12/RpoP